MDGIAPEIETSIKAHYAGNELERALRMLAEIRNPGLEPEFSNLRARVQIGVLILANGNIELLAKAIRSSQIDWRDTLVSSGLADLNNWASVATGAGYKPPACAT